jgi:hypothetical protein
MSNIWFKLLWRSWLASHAAVALVAFGLSGCQDPVELKKVEQAKQEAAAAQAEAAAAQAADKYRKARVLDSTVWLDGVPKADAISREFTLGERLVAEMRSTQPPSVGMTKKEVLESSWGRPKGMSRSNYGSYSTEQWDYGNGDYLSFSNGILVGVHTSQ